MSDEKFMLQALREAERAYEKGEVPIGSVLVYENKIIAKGYNQVELLQDATAHAEIICLTAASQYFGNWRLNGSTLYCTLEPCVMCSGALFSSRIERIVWGAKDKRVGACGSWVDLWEKKHPIHEVLVTKNVLEEPCALIIQSFFEERRRKRKTVKSSLDVC